MDRNPRRRVLVVVDRSPGDQRTVIATGALASEWDAEVVTCRVRTMCPSRCGSIESEPLGAAQQLVDEAGDALERLGVTVADRQVITSWGTPAETIVQTALEEAASMIVIANPNRAGIRARLAGRSVQRLLAVSDIPVLAVGSGRISHWRLRRPSGPRRRQHAFGHA